MPYREEWVEPELFIAYRGEFVYRTYTGDDIDQPNDFWYDTDPSDGSQGTEFDVRLLSTIGTAGGDHTKAIQLAIDKGELPKVKTEQPFRLRWEIDVTAANAIEAAKQALVIQRSPESIATVFSVKDTHGSVAQVDLNEIDSNRKNEA